jgi:hypothetical protein
MMERLSVCLAVITALCVASLTCPTQSAELPEIIEAAKPQCAKVKFHNLSRYKHERWEKVFRDREVITVLKPLLGKDYRKLMENMAQASYPEDSSSFVDRKGVLTLRGFVPGLFTIMEAMLIVEPCGNIYAAILDEGDRFLYFSNDREYLDRLPAEIERWRSSIEKARSGLEKLPIVFKSKQSP